MLHVEWTGVVASRLVDMESFVACHAHNSIDRLRNTCLRFDEEKLKIFHARCEQNADRVCVFFASE